MTPASSPAAEIRARLGGIRERIENAAHSSGRSESDVRIVAVTKKLDADVVRSAYVAGLRDFGENYVQEGLAKIEALSREMPDVRWHFIGRLQSNKAASAVAAFSLLHGIDSQSTVTAISKAAARDSRTVQVLLQVRLGERGSAGDRGRGGVEPDDAADFLEKASRSEGVRFVGLMGVADPDLDARPQFAALRELGVRLAALGIERAPLGELSMGMTGDFEDAVAEGATIVRIGTAIFGERPAG